MPVLNSNALLSPSPKTVGNLCTIGTRSDEKYLTPLSLYASMYNREGRRHYTHYTI
jgi:hypothetical protein